MANPLATPYAHLASHETTIALDSRAAVHCVARSMSLQRKATSNIGLVAETNPAVIRLNALIHQHTDKMVELFQEWDTNKDGSISSVEARRDNICAICK